MSHHFYMSHQEILIKAIQTAVNNGWEPNEFDMQDIDYITRTWPIIFLDHNFAKALWGEEGYTDTGEPAEVWQYHLQQMVIADDPIAYLEKNI